jgi:signal transduction histidine kinase
MAFSRASGLNSMNNYYMSKPILIVNHTGDVLFISESLRSTFAVKEGGNISLEDCDPKLDNLIKNFSGTKINAFQFDLNHICIDGSEALFTADIQKLVINEEELYLIVLIQNNEKIWIEDKINNLHNALEYGYIPVIITDSSGKVIFSTTTFEKILDSEADLLYNNSLVSILSTFIGDELLSLLQKAIKELSYWKTTICNLDETGILKYWDIELNPVKIGDGKSYNFILTAHDISDYVQKNRVMKKSEDRLKLFVNNISDLLLIVRQKYDVVYLENANDNFCQFFQFDKEKDFQKDINEFRHYPVINSIMKVFSGISENFYIGIEPIETPKGLRQYYVKVTSIDDLIEEEKLYIVNLNDITDQLEYEARLKKAYETEMHLNKLKTALIENLSHEIRTPFNAIMGYSDIIDECVQSSDFETLTEVSFSLKDVLNRILNLFTNIVEVAQLESDQVTVEKANLNYQDILKSVFNKKQKEAITKGLDFRLNLDPDEILLNTDSIKFEKVIMCILDNAVKYTKKGYVEIASKHVSGSVEIFITDTGRGMDQDEISRLLQPFEQGEIVYNRDYEGLGLGLTIAYRLIQILGGKLEMKSELNVGTVVKIAFRD